MSTLAPDDEAFIAKQGSVSPDDEAFVKRHLEMMTASELTSEQKRAFAPEWNTFRQALDSVTNGELTRYSPRAARAKAEWERVNPGEALAASTLPPAAFLALASTAIGRAAMMGSELAGAPILGEVLTGLAGRGAAGLSGLATRLGSSAVAGGWQGALAGSAYPSGEGTGKDLLTGMGLGAGTNLLTRIVGAPLRSHITSDVARSAERYRAQGVPLTMGQIPGASLASRMSSRLFGLGTPDSGALTRRLVASVGGTGDRLDHATIEAARDDIGKRLDSAAAGTGNMADTTLRGDLARVASLAHHGLQGQDTAYSQMRGMLAQIYDAAQSGHLTGDVYQNLTQKGSALSNALDRTSPIRQYAVPVRDALDSALERANPSAASSIRLARNQWRNSHVLEPLENETGLVDPKKFFSRVTAPSGYGGTGQASAASALAANPVDIGTLAEGAKRFPSQPGLHLGLTGGVAGGTLLGGAALEHEGMPILSTIGEHPLASAGSVALGGLYTAGGLMQSTEPYLNLALRNAQRGERFTGNMLIPTVQQAYRTGESLSPETAETEAQIRSSFRQRGIDPDIATKVARSEGLGSESYEGDEGSSFGPFQLHYGNVPGTSRGNRVSGLGDLFTAQTGLDARDPSTVPQQIEWVADHVKTHGWEAFHGWKGDDFAGVPLTVTTRPGYYESGAPKAPKAPQGAQPSNLLTGGQ